MKAQAAWFPDMGKASAFNSVTVHRCSGAGCSLCGGQEVAGKVPGSQTARNSTQQSQTSALGEETGSGPGQVLEPSSPGALGAHSLGREGVVKETVWDVTSI